MCAFFLSLSLMSVHTHTNTRHTRIMQKTCTMDRKHTPTQHSHANIVCFWDITQVPQPASLSHPHSTIKLNNILPLYSVISRLNYSPAEWTSKREDKRPSSFWNRFNMFVLILACLCAGQASEIYEVIIFRLMERIISYILFHPANHSYTSVLTS